MARVFVDQNIVSYGDTLNGERRNGVIGYVRKAPPQEGKQREQFDCLPTISQLASIGEIKLGRYIELCFEDWSRAGSFPVNDLGNLFHPKTMTLVKPAIERSYFASSSSPFYLKNSALVDFCLWLNTPGLEKLLLGQEISCDFPETMKTNISELDRYRFLCKGLSPKQCVDAFHFWSAEVNEFDFFLTMDGKFRNAMTDTKKTISNCSIVFPSELLERLDITYRKDFEFEEGYFYGIGGNKLYV